MTYENVSCTGERQQDQRPPRDTRKWNQGFSLPSKYFPVLLGFCFLLLIIIIWISVQLSAVSQHRDDTVTGFERLKEAHIGLNSTLTQDIIRKDITNQRMEEILRQTRQELELTRDLLNKSQVQLSIREERLRASVQEGRSLQDALNSCRSDLIMTKDKLRDAGDQRTRCESNLIDTTQQKQVSGDKLMQSQAALQQTQKKLKTTEDTQARITKELSAAKEEVLQVKRNLQSIRQSEGKLRENFNSLRNKWEEAQTCVPQNCAARGDGGRVHVDPFSFCPSGWKRDNDRCFYFSKEVAIRLNANDDCERRGAALTKIHEDSYQLKSWISQSKKSYWVGLRKDSDNQYRWSDDTTQQVDFQRLYPCVKASPKLEDTPCAFRLPWICEKAIEQCASKEQLLQCFGEKLEVFASK